MVLFLCYSKPIFAQEKDSLQYPFKYQSGGLYLESPMGYYAQYDPDTNTYILQQKIGELAYGDPIILTQEQYMDLLLDKSMGEYYLQKSKAVDSQFRSVRYGKKDEDNKKDKGLVLPSIQVKNKAFESIFGGSKIELIPKGYASIDLGIYTQTIDNPQLLPQNRTSFSIDLQQRIQMSILGKVGENLQLGANYDTQAGFGFENRLNLGWKPNGSGGEDNIVQNIELGNVSMPLTSSLITGAQSLFGAKTELKFGKTYVTTIFAQQQSETKTVTAQNGSAINTFKIYAKDYQSNQHYFLAQYFRDNYDTALASYPFISSQISITRLQVWVIDNSSANLDTKREIVAIRDLGEESSTPENGSLYNTISGLSGIRTANTADRAISGAGLVDDNGQIYTEGEQFLVHQNVRLLSSSEYKYYPSLGYISLNSALSDNELLAVSFQYTLTTQPGKSFSVGEFSDEQSEVLITKLLKSNTTVNTSSPMWDLMMKNIYSLDGYQLSSEDFRLNIFYKNTDIGTAGLNYLEGTSVDNLSLLQLLNMDRLNSNGEVQLNGSTYGDGLFDFVDGVTVDADNALIVFTTIEPFAQTIEDRLGGYDENYVLNDLYSELPINFEQNANADRYYLEGQYKNSGSDGISLGAFNVPQGSVKVTANGQELVEGVDYTVDYLLGKVTIINDVIKNSGTPISVSLENTSTFNTQTKRLMGLNVEHRFSEDFIVGATYMNYQERLAGTTQKAQYGVEPVSNSIFGANVMYNGTSDWLTRMTDKIPLVDTDTESRISFTAEGAYLKPGTNSATDNQTYIDDFENSQSSISLTNVDAWSIASTPIATTNVPNPDFPQSIFDPEQLSFNYNRRLISWYNIDPTFYSSSGSGALNNTELSNNASRRVLYREIYSGSDITSGTASYINTFDVSYYPDDRGPYNLDPNWQSESDDDKWAGITRSLNVTNLTQTNVEYIEFWLMDPYADGMNDSPDARILMQLGNVSEDILRDGNLMYENGINQENNTAQQSIWGNQPSDAPLLYTFSTEGTERTAQDVGFDGLSNEEELTTAGYSAFTGYQNPVTGEPDPAGDDYVYYLDEQWSGISNSNYLPERYKFFRNSQNNSPSGDDNAATSVPDAEDANADYNLDRVENYNQYTINLGKSQLNLNNNFIVDIKEGQGTFENGQTANTTWYLFRVPVSEYDSNAGAASDDILSSARYMRMIVKGFNTRATLRFASLDMVRSDWVKYAKNIYPNTSASDEGEATEDTSNFSIGSVNIEESGTASPPYMVPPGISREQIQTSTGLQSQDEASMVLNINSLDADDARGVVKSTSLDLRRYNVLKMFTHVHAGSNGTTSNDLKIFIRLGSDVSENYYEYEIPMEYTSISAVTSEAIWPEANYIDINTDDFTTAKKESYEANSTDRYAYTVDAATNKMIYVKGRPSLGSVSSIMIGVRNAGSTPIENAIVWVNELRLSDIDNQGGYAAAANLNMNLGDLAQVNASGSISTVGFGALDLGPVDRQQEDVKSYSVSTAVNLDKFLPKKWGVKIPFNYSIQEEFVDPKYNPLDDDIILDEDPNKEEIEDIVRTYNKNISYSFSNIRKERTNTKKPKRFYDIENLSLSALYSSRYYRDIYTTYDIQQQLNASLNYNYTFKPKYKQPLKDWRMVHDTAKSAEYLQWAKEFNYNLIPTRISFSTNIARTYTEQQYRDVNSYLTTGATPISFSPTYSNNFLFNWQYSVGFDLTKSLRLDYIASTRTLSELIMEAPDQKQIFKNLLNVGRPINYNQKLQINWRTPIHLLPYMQWLNLETGYTANYDWQADLSGSTIVNGVEENTGNISQNSQTISVIGQMDFNKLYSQFDVFGKANDKKRARQRELDSINRSFEDLIQKRNGFKRIKKKKVKLKNKLSVKDYLLLAAQSIKRGQFSYNRTSGIVLPGVLAEPGFFGTGKDGAGPNASFIFGSQEDIRRLAVENGWVTQSSYLTDVYASNRNDMLTASLQVQPSPSLNIDLNVKRNYTKYMSQSGFNTLVSSTGSTNTYGYQEAYENIQQTLTKSEIGIGAGFKGKDALYNTLIDYAQQISLNKGAAVGLTDTDGDGYAQGYGLANADVLVPAFLKAYLGKGLGSNKNFSFKDGIPLPNWNITYTGLTRSPLMTKYFNKFDITHSYVSTSTVSGVQSNLTQFSNPPTTDVNGNIVTDTNGDPSDGVDGNGNLYSANTYGAVTIIEAFSPLIGIDATLRNNMQFRFQYNRDRLSSLSLSNYSVTEDYGSEFIFGFGYIINDVKLKMRYMGKRKTLSGDINLRADLSIRDNEISIRDLLDNDFQVSGGQRIFSLKVNAQYILSDNFNVSLFYDQTITKYKISTSFPLSTLSAGISATFIFGK